MNVSQNQAGTLQRLRPLHQTLAGQAGLAVAASLFVAVCAHISLPLLFTPVPLTLGNFAVVLVGLLLGPRLGFASMVLYLMEGAAGMPVFNPGALGGVAQLLGPTGGYLFAYPFAAAIAGAIASRKTPTMNRLSLGLLASLAATSLVMLAGVVWLAYVAHLSARAAMLGGVLPFVPGELFKIVIAAGIFRTMTRRPSPQN